MGLDRFDQNNQPNPDQNFDFIPGISIDVEHAELIFPVLRPFDDGIRDYFLRQQPPVTGIDSLLFPDVYDTTQSGAANNTIANKYFMRGLINLGQRSKIALGFNVVEGSVQVLLNGSPMTPNVDYTVDYILGEVILRSEQASLPGATVEVKYEQNDLFQLASKTLVGARGELDAIPNTKLGFTVMNLSQETLSDKVRLGEEPTNNLILGADASSAFDLPVLTSLINALPGLRTSEMSNMKFNAEAAYMIPDPNTKKSPILSDEGKSIAMIDDFEGARRSIPFPISYSGWTMSSAPVVMRSNLDARHDSLKNWARARLEYFNVLPSDVTIEDIWPRREYRTGENRVTVLNLNFNPARRAMYNFSAEPRLVAPPLQSRFDAPELERHHEVPRIERGQRPGAEHDVPRDLDEGGRDEPRRLPEGAPPRQPRSRQRGRHPEPADQFGGPHPRRVEPDGVPERHPQPRGGGFRPRHHLERARTGGPRAIPPGQRARQGRQPGRPER